MNEPHSGSPVSLGYVRAVPARQTLVIAAVALLLPLVLATSGTAIADTTVKPPLVRFSPYGYPSYSPAIQDYVVRCDGQAPVLVEVNAPARTRVAVDGRAARGGKFSVGVDVAPGQAFTVTTTAPRLRRSHTVRCLPADLPLWTVTRRPAGSMQWYLVGLNSLGPAPPPYAVIFDRYGTPVWWFRSDQQAIDVKLLGSSIAFAHPEPTTFAAKASAHYDIHRLDGTLVQRVVGAQSPIDFHELQMRGGNFVYLSYRPRPRVDLSRWGGPADGIALDAVIEEVTPSGSLVWSWNSKDHVAVEEFGTWLTRTATSPLPLPSGDVAYDIAHPNSIDLRGDTILLSLRHADAVYKIRRSTGDIIWKLGGTRTARSLTIRGDAYAPYVLGGQHDARLLADGSVTLYDNQLVKGRRARAVRYRIDEQRRTATLVEEITSSIPYASLCCGSARKLPNAGWLISWGGLPAIEEYDRNGNLTFGINLSSFMSYRVQGVPSGRISRAALQAGMNAMYPR